MIYPKKNKVVKTKLCCACKVEKQINDFYKNKSLLEGYEKRCKICKKNKVRCRKVGREKYNRAGRPFLRDAPQLYNVKKKDWIEMFNFFKKLGYSLDRSIHEQFCERHNLQPRKRMYENSIQYTPKDLGMI